ncbi:MAG: T9SS C-terminal target domain-containing protein [Bacteroidetes bacterium]|nr:MAG: T9SS C-terminal target domain-containing protein [Bacteroidota bacterium]
MKKFTLYALFTLAVCQIQAQTDCLPNGIRTDWTNPSPAIPPSNRPFEKNIFNWQEPNFNRFDKELNNENTIASPFFDNSQLEGSSRVLNYFDSDFKPADGWELIHQNFGYLYDGTKMTFPVPSQAPYILLYNKYSGKLRVLFSPPNGYNAFQSFIVEILPKNKFNDSGPFKTSALFNHNFETSSPLDIYSTNKPIRATTPKSNYGHMACAEFQMGYDPCTCFHPSNFEIKFFAVSSSSITMKGRALGAISGIDNDKGSPFYGYDNTKSYLTSVYKNDNNSIGTGASIYNSWGTLERSYKSQYDAFVAANADADFFSSIGKGLTGIGSGLMKNSPDWTTKIAGIGISGLGFISNMFSSSIKKSVDEPARPMALHAELALTGTITTETSTNANIQFVNPGSLESKTAPEFNNQNGYSYPVYNEVLGTFALLQTPKVKYYQSPTILRTPVTHMYVFNQAQLTHASMQKHTLQLDLSTIKFAINPALNINEDATEIYYALVSDFNYGTDGADNSAVYGFNNFYKLGDDRVGVASNYKAKFISSFQPLECTGTSVLYNTAMRVLLNLEGTNYPTPKNNLFNSSNVFVRIMLKLRTHPNPVYNNQVNEVLQVFTYPVTVENTTIDPTNSDLIPIQNRMLSSTNACDVVVLGDPTGKGVSWSSFNNITAGSNCGGTRNYYFFTPVTVPSNVSTAQGTTSNIYSTGDIKVFNTVATVNVNSEVSLNPQFGVNYSDNGGCTSKKYSVNKDGNFNFQAFCTNSNFYKSNKLSAREEAIYAENRKKEDLKIQKESPFKPSLKAVPNPTTGRVTFYYKIASAGEVSIKIANVMGTEVVSVLERVPKEIGNYEQDLNLTALPTGVYVVTIECNGYKNTERLVVSSN